MCCNQSCSKILLFVFSAIFMAAGVSLIGVGMLVKYSKHEFDVLIGSALLNGVTYGVIGVGAAITVGAMVGCLTAVTMNRKIVVLYTTLVICLFLLQAACGIMGFVYYEQTQVLLDQQVYDTMTTKYGDPQYNLVTIGIDAIQQKLQCCGYLEPMDWVVSPVVASMNDTSVPVSCCKNINLDNCNQHFNSTDIYTVGCRPSLEALVQDNMLIVGLTCMGMALAQLLGVVSAIHLCKTTHQSVNF